jgi:membrane fusion protein (multidrug efflux system)
MYVRATIEEGMIKDSYLVPQRAVDHTADGSAVAKVVASDGKVAQRTLTVDRSVGNNWVVTDGIKDGDQLIVEGAAHADVGKPVKATVVAINDKTGEITPVEAKANTKSSTAEQKVQVSER